MIFHKILQDFLLDVGGSFFVTQECDSSTGRPRVVDEQNWQNLTGRRRRPERCEWLGSRYKMATKSTG